MTKTKRRFASALRAVLALVALAAPIALTSTGCGGSNNSKTPSAGANTAGTRTARATVNITWPARTESRLIPVASNSIRITFTNATGFRTSQVFARPATSATFENLPPGALTVSATAHADGAGEALPPQASSIQQINVTVDEPFALNLTMGSTIDRLLLTQAAASVGVGKTVTFAVAALDASGNTILTSGATYQWASSDPAVASIQPDGLTATVTGLVLKSATISVTESESGKTASLPLIITLFPPAFPVPAQAVAYQINPAHSGNTTFGQPLTFPSTPTWSVEFGGLVSYPLIAGGRVFVTTRRSDGNYGTVLHALNTATGLSAWEPVNLGGSFFWSGLTYDQGKVFTVDGDGLVRSFDAATGTPGWSTKLSRQYSFSAAPTAVNGILYVGGAGSGGTLFALDETNGTTLWEQDVQNGDISSPTLSPEGDGVFVSYPGQVYKFNPQTGALLWHKMGGGSGGGGKTSAYSNGLLYVRDLSSFDLTGSDSSTFIYDALTGALVNGSKIGGRNIDPIPALGATTGYFLIDSSYSGGGTLQALDLASRKAQWSFEGDGRLISPPLIIDQTVIAASVSGVVYALDAATGGIKWQGTAGDNILRSDEQNVSQPLTGIGAGEGYLLVPAGKRLTAWRIVP